MRLRPRARFSAPRWLAVEQPANGRIISALAAEMCRTERPARVLLVRTPTTGGWQEQLSLPAATERVVLRYAASYQPNPGEAWPSHAEHQVAMQALAQRGERFDLIVIDPAHEYPTSLADFELCRALLAPDGVLLSHDCAPASLALAAPRFTRGGWCGLTYAALVALALRHPELAVTVLDTDTGVGIVRWRASRARSRWLPPVAVDRHGQARLVNLVESEHFDEAWQFFRRHGPALVGLISRSKAIAPQRGQGFGGRLRAALGWRLRRVRRGLSRLTSTGRQPAPPSPAPRAAQLSSARQDLETLPIQPDACLQVFHKHLPIGRGAAISLYVHGQEVLKFDCFGPGKGHFHIAPRFGRRILLREQTPVEQIARALFELRHNARNLLAGHSRPEVRDCVLEPVALDAALVRARELLLGYETLHAGLRTPVPDASGGGTAEATNART